MEEGRRQCVVKDNKPVICKPTQQVSRERSSQSADFKTSCPNGCGVPLVQELSCWKQAELPAAMAHQLPCSNG